MRAATLTIETTKSLSEAICHALDPESRREISRTAIDITPRDNGLTLRIMAEDTTALMAALNSYIRWVQVAIDTLSLTNMEN